MSFPASPPKHWQIQPAPFLCPPRPPSHPHPEPLCRPMAAAPPLTAVCAPGRAMPHNVLPCRRRRRALTRPPQRTAPATTWQCTSAPTTPSDARWGAPAAASTPATRLPTTWPYRSAVREGGREGSGGLLHACGVAVVCGAGGGRAGGKGAGGRAWPPAGCGACVAARQECGRSGASRCQRDRGEVERRGRCVGRCV